MAAPLVKRTKQYVDEDLLPRLDDPKAPVPLVPFGGVSQCGAKWWFRIAGVCKPRFLSSRYDTYELAKQAYDTKCRDLNAFNAWYWKDGDTIVYVHRRSV